jgi:hypothetical protein
MEKWTRGLGGRYAKAVGPQKVTPLSALGHFCFKGREVNVLGENKILRD